MQGSEPKGQSSAKGIKRFFSLVAIFALFANLKTTLTLGFGVFKFGWLVPMVGSLLVSLVLYASVYGWSLAFIVIPLILVHEMGHWIWMRAYNLSPKAPVFIPFLGAFVAMQKMPANEATHAWVAFSGPFVGGLGALACYAIGKSTGQHIFLAAAFIGFFLNLMQLIPAKPLDGGFIVGAISKWFLVPGVFGLFYLGAIWNSVFLDIIGIMAVLSLFRKQDKLGVTAATVKELEEVFVASVNALPYDKEGKPNKFRSGKATLAQRCAIGAAYLGLVAALGLMITWITLESGNAEKAFVKIEVKILDRMIAVKDDAQTRFLRAQLYASDNNLDMAKVDYVKALDMGKRDYDAYYNLGRCKLLSACADKETVEDFIQAAHQAKQKSDEIWAAAYGLLLCGAYDEVEKICTQTPTDTSGLVAEVAERKGQIDKARDFYNKAVNERPELYWGPRWRRAMFNISEHRLNLVSEDVEKALKFSPKEPTCILTEAWYMFAKKEYDAAWKNSDRVFETSLDSTAAEKQFILAGCHRLRYEIAKLKSTEGGKWQTIEQDEKAKLDQHPNFDTLYAPRNLH